MNSYKFFQKLFLVFYLCASGTLFAQSVRFVDSEIGVSGTGTSWGTAFKTIQEAINAASSGDDILVAYGSDGSSQTYSISSQLEINDKNLRITSAKYGTDNTYAAAQYDSTKVIISAIGTNRLFYIHGNNVTNSTVIRGFKLANGNATNSGAKGGAIYTTTGADPTISNCWITSNKATTSGNGFGGGITSEDVSPVITHNLIENNIAKEGDGAAGYGGGIRVQGGSATITYNTIRNNVAGSDGIGEGFGGGVSTYNISTTISNNTISGNTGGIGNGRGYGGGISIQSSGNHTISNNTISSNIANSGDAEGWGGGLYVDDNYGGWGSTTVTSCIFYNNTAATNAATWADNNYGGGIYTGRGIIITNNIFNYNTALSNTDDATNNAYGGAAFFKGGNIENNTFYENANRSVSGSAGGGSGIYFAYGNWPSTFINNVFVNHNTTARPNSDGIAVYAKDFELPIQYSGFYNNGNNFGGDASDGGNNVFTDPRFTNASSGDFTLLYNSPCIDAGTGDYTYNESTNHDYGWKYDIGAEEYSGTRVMKSITGTGEVLFGGKVRSKINITTQGTLSAIDITVHENSNHANAVNSVKRWFEISATGSGATCNITLSYKDSELNGESESSLKLYRRSGSSWEGPKSASSSSTDDNWLTCNGQTSFSEWIIDADGALPVELISFSGVCQNEVVELHWETATEINNYGFEVERYALSTIPYAGDGKEHSAESKEWEEICFVNGHGNSNSPKYYSFVDDLSAGADNFPNGDLQYRLKQIDFDGAFEYSDVVSITNSQNYEFELEQNYPNPFNPATTISFTIPNVGTQHAVYLRVYDILGSEVAVLVNEIKTPGNYKINFDAGKLASGLYFYTLTSGNFRQTRKMLLLK